MKILFITDNYYPETNAPAQRTQYHCEYWANDLGCEVEVITGVPNFPIGKCYQNYVNKSYQQENINGVKVHRVWTFIAKNTGRLFRIFDFLSFMLSAVLFSFRAFKADVVVATSPQFFTLIAGFVVSRLKKVKFVIEVRDIWPDSVVAVGVLKESLAIKIIRVIEKNLYKSADKIIIVSPAFISHIKNLGIPEDKVSTVTNGVDRSRFEKFHIPDVKKEFGFGDQTLITYIGTIGLAHDVLTILAAAELLLPVTNLHFVIAGDGAEREVVCERAEKLENVTVLAPLSLDKVAKLHLISDVSIVHLRKHPVFESVLPSKIFESFAAGTPILLGVDGTARELVEKYTAGIYFEPQNPIKLVEAITTVTNDRKLMEKYSNNGAQASVDFDRSVLAHQMFCELNIVVAENPT